MAKIVNKKYETSEHVVAFIDILGAKKLITKNENSLQKIHDALDNAFTKFSELSEILKFDGSVKPEIKTFSDNIIIFSKISSYPSRDIFSLITLTAFIQKDLLVHDILTRGGITIGDFFSDNMIVWGKALVDAYMLETQISIYPRLIIEPKAVNKIVPILESTIFSDDFSFFIKQDLDNLYYLNYFCTLNYPHVFSVDGKNVEKELLDTYGKNAIPFLENDSQCWLKVMDFILKEKAENKDDLRIMQKLLWVERQINDTIKKIGAIIKQLKSKGLENEK